MPLEEDPKAVCWRPKQALIECIMKTKCFKEMGEIDQCIAAAECHLERKNWVLCKCNVMNPRYRLRGNPYDIGSEDQKKIEARNERIARRLADEQGLNFKSNRGVGSAQFLQLPPQQEVGGANPSCHQQPKN